MQPLVLSACLNDQSENQARVKTYTPKDNPLKRHKAEADKVSAKGFRFVLELGWARFSLELEWLDR